MLLLDWLTLCGEAERLPEAWDFSTTSSSLHRCCTLWETDFSDPILNELPTGFRLLYHIISTSEASLKLLGSHFSDKSFFRVDLLIDF
jgi:hypothetical protein